MKTNRANQHCWLLLWLPLLAYQTVPGAALAKDTLEVPLVEVVDLALAPLPLIGKRVGVAGVVLCIDQFTCTLGDLVGSRKRSLILNVNRMRSLDRRRLVLDCFYSKCFEILIGTLTRRGFIATRSYSSMLPAPAPEATCPNQGKDDWQPTMAQRGARNAVVRRVDWPTR
jgi:hypothetical protein